MKLWEYGDFTLHPEQMSDVVTLELWFVYEGARSKIPKKNTIKERD